MILGINFIIAAGLVTLALIPLYIYREKIFKKREPQKGDLYFFQRDVKLHLSQHHPKIHFNLSIIEKSKSEEDIRIRELIIVENLASQFFYAPYEKTTQKSVAKEKLWVNYDEKSASNPKLPSDWQQRKELVWNRDNRKCSRCGEDISLFKNAYTQFVKDISRGGAYNVENIILVCQDCNQVLNSQNPQNTISSLPLYDRLMIFATDK